MSKNIMPQVLKMLNVEYGEKFKLRDGEVYEYGSFVIKEGEGLVGISDYGTTSLCNEKLYDILSGYLEVVKLPWEPKKGERYYFPRVDAYLKGEMVVGDYTWDFATFELAMKALGMVYRTKEEAEAHFAEDYEKLTGKKLE